MVSVNFQARMVLIINCQIGVFCPKPRKGIFQDDSNDLPLALIWVKIVLEGVATSGIPLLNPMFQKVHFSTPSDYCVSFHVPEFDFQMVYGILKHNR